MRNLSSGLLAALLGSGLPAQSVEDFKFEVETLGGRKLSQADLVGNVVIVDLWGTWCGPCVQAVPVLEDLYRKYKHFGLEIVGLNYEVARGDHAGLVREFAAKHGITYALALGTPAIKAQVPGFRGYPTMLFFKRGMVHSHTKVGFDPSEKAALGRWVRDALGIADEAGPKPPPKPEEEPEEIVEEEPEEEVAEPAALADGVIFKPGSGDRGFAFAAEDVDGKAIEFVALAGKPVLLAVTSSWDGSSVPTARLLQTLHEARGSDVHVIAASIEMSRQGASKVKAIQAFRAKHGLAYRVVPAGLDFQKKIHRFSGVPTFLVFDKEGTLVLRENGLGDDTRKKIEAMLSSLGK